MFLLRDAFRQRRVQSRYASGVLVDSQGQVPRSSRGNRSLPSSVVALYMSACRISEWSSWRVCILQVPAVVDEAGDRHHSARLPVWKVELAVPDNHAGTSRARKCASAALVSSCEG